MPALIPELAVSDVAASTGFYAARGGETVYDRPEAGFARLRLGLAEITLDQLGIGRAPDEFGAGDPPFGPGVNLQIEVDRPEPLLAALLARGQAPRPGSETRWYRAGPVEIGQRQLRVTDPDGDLLRFFETLGTRPADEAQAEEATRPEPRP